jgi:predicted dehydrogenase
MEPLNLMLVGCGMMGARHLRGYGELERVRPGTVRVRAVCDPVAELAEVVASEAEELVGYRPPVYASPEEALAGEEGIEAADIVTGNRSHDPIAVPLLEAGVHCLVEKPLGLTVARAKRIIVAAREADRVLAVAENNRRDPMNRLVSHILDEGLIGEPNLVLMTSIGTGRRIVATPWRHATANGGLALDVGIHLGYILEAFLGPIDTVCATSRQVWPTRIGPGPDGKDTEYEVESDDVFVAELTFESGARGSWVMSFAATGMGAFQRTIFGAAGTLETPSDRGGATPRVRLEGETLEGDGLVERLPGYRLNDIEARLWGERPSSYKLPSPETDRKLIASEVSDFAGAIREGREPEVPGELGLRSVAIIWALLESVASGCPVTLDEVVAGDVCEAQAEAEAAGGNGA